MSTIGYLLGNATQTITSILPETVGIGEAGAAIAWSAGQAIGTITGSVAMLGAIGGGIALWRHVKAPQAQPEEFLSRDAILECLQDGRLSLTQVPHLCDDFDAVFTATEFNPFAVALSGRELRQTPRFREIAMCAAEGYAALIQNRPSFRDWIVNSIHVFRNGNVMESLPEFHNDFEILRVAADADPETIRYAGEELYQNPLFRELVLGFIRRDPYLLASAGPFQNDYEIVGRAIAVMPGTIDYAGRDLRLRPEFNHLRTIALLRTPILNGDEVIREGISYQEAIRMLHKNPNSTLEEEIGSWLNECKYAFPDRRIEEPRFALEGDPKRLLKNFLGRVREVQDYQNGGQGRANVIALVYNILHLAAGNEEFRGCMIANLSQAETDCDDNVLIRLVDIEVMSQMYNPKLTAEQFRTLAIGVERYERLKERVLSRHPGNEEIETLLCLLLKLKQSLNLPISTLTMGHESVAKVTEKMIGKAEEEILSISERELLAKSNYWNNWVAVHRKPELERIENAYGNLMGDLDDYFGLEESEQPGYLQDHEELGLWLQSTFQAGIANEYSALGDFLVKDKALAIGDIR